MSNFFSVVSIPIEIAHTIFSLLSIRELANCSRVNKAWYTISSADEIWKRKVTELLPFFNETLYQDKKEKNLKNLLISTSLFSTADLIKCFKEFLFRSQDAYKAEFQCDLPMQNHSIKFEMENKKMQHKILSERKILWKKAKKCENLMHPTFLLHLDGLHLNFSSRTNLIKEKFELVIDNYLLTVLKTNQIALDVRVVFYYQKSNSTAAIHLAQESQNIEWEALITEFRGAITSAIEESFSEDTKKTFCNLQ